MPFLSPKCIYKYNEQYYIYLGFFAGNYTFLTVFNKLVKIANISILDPIGRRKFLRDILMNISDIEENVFLIEKILGEKEW